MSASSKSAPDVEANERAADALLHEGAKIEPVPAQPSSLDPGTRRAGRFWLSLQAGFGASIVLTVLLGVLRLVDPNFVFLVFALVGAGLTALFIKLEWPPFTILQYRHPTTGKPLDQEPVAVRVSAPAPAEAGTVVGAASHGTSSQPKRKCPWWLGHRFVEIDHVDAIVASASDYFENAPPILQGFKAIGFFIMFLNAVAGSAVAAAVVSVILAALLRASAQVGVFLGVLLFIGFVTLALRRQARRWNTPTVSRYSVCERCKARKVDVGGSWLYIDYVWLGTSAQYMFPYDGAKVPISVVPDDKRFIAPRLAVALILEPDGRVHYVLAPEPRQQQTQPTP
ncbi:MAG: hypothetical protein JO036_21320 [Candidatus Eremiobacteraeota bacterium]|nr:hypothetical protein [Candidatus Eremiobacteraeota bacterium]